MDVRRRAADVIDIFQAVVNQLMNSARGSPGGGLTGCFLILVLGAGFAALTFFFVINIFASSAPAVSDDDVAAVSDWAGSFGGWGEGESQTLVVPDINTDTSSTTTSTPTTTTLPPIISSGSWQFTEFAGEMDCDGLVITIAPSGAISGEIAVLEDSRLLVTGVGDDLAEVLAELDEDAPDANTYVGAIAPQDAVEGVNLVFTITFQDDEPTTTHIGGSIVSDGVTCSVDRPGEATFTG